MRKDSGQQDYDGIVICSTHNQMVNYLTILQHLNGRESADIICLTVDGQCYSSQTNTEWNQSLEKALKRQGITDLTYITFNNSEIANHETIMKKLRGISDKYKKLLWNITGGQRHLIMAITTFVYTHRKADMLVYFEGNQSKFYYYSQSDSDPEQRAMKDSELGDFDFEKLNLGIAFQLMGFDLSETVKKERKDCRYVHLTATSCEEFISKCNGIDPAEAAKLWEQYNHEMDFYSRFYDEFIKNNNLDLLKLLIKTNKENGQLEETVAQLRDKGVFSGEDAMNTFRASLEHVAKGKLFGYILEYMAFYKIVDVICANGLVDKIADIHLSSKVKFDNTDQLGIIDEFDISILTKTGKVIIFECKSGAFDGDNMKSHHYSTYAVSGVYGTPILIMPFTSTLGRDPDKMSDDERKIYETFNGRKKAAKRAKIQVWDLDKLEYEIKKIIKK